MLAWLSRGDTNWRATSVPYSLGLGRASHSAGMQVYDIRNNKEAVLSLQAHIGAALCLDYHPMDSNLLASGGSRDNKIKVRSLHGRGGPYDAPASLALNPRRFAQGVGTRTNHGGTELERSGNGRADGGALATRGWAEVHRPRARGEP